MRTLTGRLVVMSSRTIKAEPEVKVEDEWFGLMDNLAESARLVADLKCMNNELNT